MAQRAGTQHTLTGYFARSVTAACCCASEEVELKLRVEAGSLAGVFEEQSKLGRVVGEEVEEVTEGRVGE